jgi:acyl carrier protein
LEIDGFIDNLRSVFDNGGELSLTPETDMHSLEEWDSLAVLGFITMVDSEYGVKISAAEIKAANTPQDLFGLVEGKLVRS